jgi:hypothetical protein
MNTRHDLLTTVLQRPPQEVDAWLDRCVIGEAVGGEDFNWEVFAFTAAAQAGDERSVLWARIALRVYEALLNHAPPRSAHSTRISAMNLRARMIASVGPQEGDAVLDPKVIVEWFRGIARMSPEDAAKVASADLRMIPIETLRELRDIKNALNVLSLLEGIGLEQKHPELRDWLQLKPMLP